MTFNIVYDTEHGNTVYVDNPKLSAYQKMAHLKMCGVGYSTTFHANGDITVNGDNGSQMSFKPYL